ncbi:GreA/GreB family elongation factor [Phenylobacterium sp.]|uniref:GreA/GreB family elongation factor n=1 Tax=Phenylobacterium sp. TaxID=1871053 RepID=UPI003565FCE4
MLNQYPENPAVRMTLADYERLSALSAGVDTLGGSILSDELERAVVIAADDPDQGFVRLHTRVEYVDLNNGRTRTLEIVPPDEADIDRRRVSVLSPVGAALIGLAAGESYGWTGEDGRDHVLVVVAVESRHEDA